MIDKWWLLVGGAHFAAFGALLKLLELVLPSCITGYYSSTANCLLYLYFAGFTFEITRKWYLKERVRPQNKAVFITGCASGFGYHLAKRLDTNGYHVFAGCRNANSAGAEELERTSSERLKVLEIDVSKDISVQNAVDFVKENLGAAELWAIVNNAGVAISSGVEFTGMEDFKHVLEVNTLGTIRVTKAFLPLLKLSRGRIVNMNSIARVIPLQFSVAYTISKYALAGFNECLMQDMDAWGIRVIEIQPDFYKTSMINIETIISTVEELYRKQPIDVREDYGEKYIERGIVFSQYVIEKLASENIDPVMDALDDAISLKHPNSVYRPSKNFFFQVLYYVLERVPRSFRLAFIVLWWKIAGIPTPRRAKNKGFLF